MIYGFTTIIGTDKKASWKLTHNALYYPKIIPSFPF